MVTYYEKRGKRYYPVLEKDIWGGDVWSEGCHLVICKPGIRSTRYNIEPDDAAFIAAQTIAAEQIAKLIVEASAAHPEKNPITQEQKDAWEKLKTSFGGGPYFLRYESAAFIARKFLEDLRNKYKETTNDQ